MKPTKRNVIAFEILYEGEKFYYYEIILHIRNKIICFDIEDEEFSDEWKKFKNGYDIKKEYFIDDYKENVPHEIPNYVKELLEDDVGIVSITKYIIPLENLEHYKILKKKIEQNIIN